MDASRCKTASRLLAALPLSFLLLLPSLVSADPAAAATPQEVCAAQYAAAQAAKARIAAHNARPHQFVVPRDQAAADAYDAEAKDLTATQDKAVAAYMSCFNAMMALADAAGTGDLNFKEPTPGKRAEIERGKQRLGSGWTPLPPPRSGANWQVPKNSPLRPLFDAVRKDNPGSVPYTYFKGGTKLTAGAPDPAYPRSSGRLIEASRNGRLKISADHIVPLSELVQMPGFTKLSADYMFIITRAPINFQWLSAASNLSKQSRSAAYVTGADLRWINSQVALEQDVRGKLQTAIDQLLKIQGN
ncbi:hypothetical protein [Kitasatospora purpeofusca]|uniref:hypothetical protein n=1 Tax=Kitasatospora purpeofusca TaxID=67352 RepID=UPI002A59B0E1|nr:hypothetical protein [Kitasatospora purpeofusca]MDY0811441.1 hypothetical protein [Kitasatospora purpeofusca]